MLASKFLGGTVTETQYLIVFSQFKNISSNNYYLHPNFSFLFVSNIFKRNEAQTIRISLSKQSPLEPAAAPNMDSLRKNFTQQITAALVELIEKGANADCPADLRQALLELDPTHTQLFYRILEEEGQGASSTRACEATTTP